MSEKTRLSRRNLLKASALLAAGGLVPDPRDSSAVVLPTTRVSGSHFDLENDFAGDTSLPRTIGNFWPYATTLYDYINRSMPMATPGTLTADEIYSLVAYLLYLNGIVEEDTVIDAATLPSIEMPANRLFYWSEEARALTDQDDP